jgi:enoyl-CoA hydratase/carnithine racemase
LSDFETIIYEKRHAKAYITLNRPKSLNVYNIRMRDELYEALQAVRDDNEVKIEKPIIAALHGYVLGSGVEMALLCDMRIASEDTQFGVPEMGLGIIPAAGGSQTLPRTVRRGYAMEMLLSGRWLKADEACRIGMVNKVVTRPDLLPTVEVIADRIASFNSVAVSCAKQAIIRGLDMPLLQGLELEARLARRVICRMSV